MLEIAENEVSGVLTAEVFFPNPEELQTLWLEILRRELLELTDFERETFALLFEPHLDDDFVEEVLSGTQRAIAPADMGAICSRLQVPLDEYLPFSRDPERDELELWKNAWSAGDATRINIRTAWGLGGTGKPPEIPVRMFMQLHFLAELQTQRS